MSEYFTGVTFPWQKVTPSDDAVIRRKALTDGILSGCAFSYSGSTLTMAAGELLICGRKVNHAAAQNWAITGATSGYARLIITVDTTRTSTKDAFDQVVDSIQYATSLAGFPGLQQADINRSGTVYQMVACVVSLGTGGISGIVSAMGAAQPIPSSEYVVTVPASGWGTFGSAWAQQVSVPGLRENDRPIVDVYLTGALPEDAANDISLDEEWAKVYRVVALNDALALFAKDAPAANLPIWMKVVK